MNLSLLERLYLPLSQSEMNAEAKLGEVIEWTRDLLIIVELGAATLNRASRCSELTQQRRWEKSTFKPTIDCESTACMIEDMILLTEQGQKRRTELLKVNDDGSWSSKVCSTPLPQKIILFHYTLTSVDGKEVT